MGPLRATATAACNVLDGREHDGKLTRAGIEPRTDCRFNAP
jgi:hypothetical protein